MTHPYNTVPSRTDVPSADLTAWYNARSPQTLRPSDGSSRAERHWIRTATVLLIALVGAELAGWLRLVQIADHRLATVAAAVAMAAIPTVGLLAGSTLIFDASWGIGLDRIRLVDIAAGAVVTGVLVVAAGRFLAAYVAVYLVAMVLTPAVLVAALGQLRQAGTARVNGITDDRPGGVA